MTLERIHIRNLLIAKRLDRLKIFELSVGLWFFFICTNMVMWFVQLEEPTANQEMVMIQSIGFMAAAMAVLRKSNSRLPTINVKKTKKIIKGK